MIWRFATFWKKDPCIIHTCLKRCIHCWNQWGNLIWLLFFRGWGFEGGGVWESVRYTRYGQRRYVYMYGMYKYRCLCICILLLCFDQRITLWIPPGENQNFAVDFSGSDGCLKSIGDTVRVVSIRFCVKFTNHAVKQHCQPRCRLKTEIEQQCW